MTLYIPIIGIDGSGKSSLAAHLPRIVAAELGIRAVSLTEDLWGHAPEEDLFRPGFVSTSEPLSFKISRHLSTAARRAHADKKRYPHLKILQLAMQERARHRVEKDPIDLIFGDGNLYLSSAGRMVNYFRQKGSFEPGRLLRDLHQYVTYQRPLPQYLHETVTGLGFFRRLWWLDQYLKWGLFRKPDGIILLDITPEIALDRLRKNSQRLHAHENLADLMAAREMYCELIPFCQKWLGPEHTAVIDTSKNSLSDTLHQAVNFVATHIFPQSTSSAQAQPLLGSSANFQNKGDILKQVIRPRYARYMVRNWAKGSWRELSFPFSHSGRMMLKHGYSAELMDKIYTQEGKNRLGELLFYQYALHQTLKNRFAHICPIITQALSQKINDPQRRNKTIKIMTAPCGYSRDLQNSLYKLKANSTKNHFPLKIWASDLDPNGYIEKIIQNNFAPFEIPAQFLKGDITSPLLQSRLMFKGPYDLILFVGFSTWISRQNLLKYLRFINGRLLAPGGTLIVDCFSAGWFAESGKLAGYKAGYDTPQSFTTLLHYCGFTDAKIEWTSEANSINHIAMVTKSK